MEAVSTIRVGPRTSTRPDRWAEDFGDDPRWLLANRVLTGRYFSRSPLLSKFLLYIVAETLEGRQEHITEHQIGVQVFGRPASYRTVEDNIVRNYARQLRRRLADHFAASLDESMYIEIPLGGYIPVFTPRTAQNCLVNGTSALGSVVSEQPEVSVSPAAAAEARTRFPAWSRVLLGALAIAAYSALLIALTLAFVHRHASPRPAAGPPNILWQTLLNGSRNTYIVPPDAGFNLVEDLTHHPVSLAEYIQGGYARIPLPRFDDHSAQDLRVHEFTDFVDMQILTSIQRLPEFNPQRVSLRFPRDLRLDDLKNANALIVGSLCSNPWASLADSKTNFRIVCSEGMQSSSILNRNPLPGENQTYVSHWNEPTHDTYALILLVPNLSGDGHLLLLEGLDVAGTQAAAEALLHSDIIAPILQRARRPDGSLGHFEVLLRATSIESNATGTEVVASRID